MFVRTLFCFIIFIDLQVRGFIGGHGELVTTFVFRDIGVSFYPDEFHAVFAIKGEELSPEVWVLFFLESGLFPTEYPTFFNGIDHVFRVGVDGHVAPFEAQGGKPDDDGEQFHTVVRGVRVAAGELLFMPIAAQDAAPAAPSWIAEA